MQVKEAMVDDAQASIAALKSQLAAAQTEASESAQALRHAEVDLAEHEAEEQRQHQSLRCATEAFSDRSTAVASHKFTVIRHQHCA